MGSYSHFSRMMVTGLSSTGMGRHEQDQGEQGFLRRKNHLQPCGRHSNVTKQKTKQAQPRPTRVVLVLLKNYAELCVCVHTRQVCVHTAPSQPLAGMTRLWRMDSILDLWATNVLL